MKAKKIEDIYELSPLQQGMLFQELYSPEQRPYVVQFIFILRGRLNTQAIHHAWQRVVDNHPILRSSFFWEKIEKSLQVVQRAVKLPMEREDWSGLSEAEQQQRRKRYLDQDRQLFQKWILKTGRK